MKTRNQKYRIGIDIGGTNTDIVLVDSKNAVAFRAKAATTRDVHKGVEKVLKQMIDETKIDRDAVSGVFFGTTQMANALHQKEGLFRVGVIRIAGQQPQSLPSCYCWPQDLKNTLYVDTVTVDGGFECHGDPISPINILQIKTAIHSLLKKNIESLAVVGVFSSLNPHHELLVKDIAQELTGGKIPVSLSHQIGGIGFIERENSTVLNASLKRVMANVFQSLMQSCTKLGLACPIWVTQNNGSIFGINDAIEYPVLSISAGPTNSFIGGMRLAQLEDAIVIDVGGTSTDIGVVQKGLPRRCFNNSNIGGIPLNFSMPDVYSIALGGGSHIKISQEINIGPLSSGNKTFTESVSFGGHQLTLTDIALALGYIHIPEAQPSNVKLSHKGCKAVIDVAVKNIYEIISRFVNNEEKQLPIVLIGGGAALFPKTYLDSRFVIPTYANVANAYGASLAEISATIDTVVSLEERQKVLDDLQQQAIQSAIQKGADYKTVKIGDIQILPYHYVPNRMARVIIRASGKQPTN